MPAGSRLLKTQVNAAGFMLSYSHYAGWNK